MLERRYTYSRVCRCSGCRARDAAAFSGIVAGSYSPRELRALERIDRAERIAELERALLAPAASAGAVAVHGSGSPYGSEGI